MSEQRTLCPKCGFPSLGARIRPHNCAARIAHPERYQSPSPAARSALVKCAPGTPSTSIPKREKHEQGINGQSSPAPGALAAPVKGAKPMSLATLDAPAPFVGESEDAMLGRQLSEQWSKVVGGQREQLIFGAMMMKLRERFRDSARGVAHGNEARKGTGLKAWLKEFAPKVSEPTAYRLMEIAEGVQAEFRLGAKVDLEALLAAAVENLDAKLAKKRAEIEQCIEGQSQRQLLLTFGKEMKRKGGARTKGEDAEPTKPAGWTEKEWAAYLALDPEVREAEDTLRPTIDECDRLIASPESIGLATKATRTHFAQTLRKLLSLLS